MTASDEARKALNGVTPGPWWHYIDGFAGSSIKANCNTDPDAPDSSVVLARVQKHDAITFKQEKANARFIAWSREGVPALLAEIAAKDAEIARLREAMAPFDRMAGAMFARNWNKDGVAISFVEKDGPIRLTFADFLAVRAAMKGDTHE